MAHPGTARGRLFDNCRAKLDNGKAWQRQESAGTVIQQPADLGFTTRQHELHVDRIHICIQLYAVGVKLLQKNLSYDCHTTASRPGFYDKATGQHELHVARIRIQLYVYISYVVGVKLLQRNSIIRL